MTRQTDVRYHRRKKPSGGTGPVRRHKRTLKDQSKRHISAPPPRVMEEEDVDDFILYPPHGLETLGWEEWDHDNMAMVWHSMEKVSRRKSLKGDVQMPAIKIEVRKYRPNMASNDFVYIVNVYENKVEGGGFYDEGKGKLLDTDRHVHKIFRGKKDALEYAKTWRWKHLKRDPDRVAKEFEKHLKKIPKGHVVATYNPATPEGKKYTPSQDMVGWRDGVAQTPVHYKFDRKGRKRAYRYERRQMRWFPLGVKEADKRVMTGKAYITPDMEGIY